MNHYQGSVDWEIDLSKSKQQGGEVNEFHLIILKVFGVDLQCS